MRRTQASLGCVEKPLRANNYKLLLKRQYFRCEMKEGTSVDKHLKYMKDITAKLAVIGAPISEEDQVVTLLGSLPKVLLPLSPPLKLGWMMLA